MQTSAANRTHQQSPAKRPLRYEAYFRRRDHITDEYKLVYKAPMELVIAGCKHLSTFSLAVAAALVSYKYATEEQLSDVMANKQIVFGPLMSDADELLWFGVAFVVFNVAILAACDRVPLRIYRKQNEYVDNAYELLPSGIMMLMMLFNIYLQLCGNVRGTYTADGPTISVRLRRSAGNG